MRKLPVFATTGRAYTFLRREFGTIIRVSWLLFLIAAIVEYVATLYAIEALRSSADPDSAMRAIQNSSGTGVKDILVYLIDIVATAIVAVALHRVILFGERRPGNLVHVAFGKVELLFVAIGILGMVATLVLTAAGVLSAIPLITLIGPGIFALIVFAVLAICVFAWVRLSLVLPLAVVTRRIRFGQSWHLTKGNFWRLLAAWMLVTLPISILLLVILKVAVPMPSAAAMLNVDPHAKAEALAAWMSSAGLFQIIVGFFASIIWGALGVAVLSYSYKALSGHAPDEILAPQAE